MGARAEFRRDKGLPARYRRGKFAAGIDAAVALEPVRDAAVGAV